MKWLRAGRHLARGDRARDRRDWPAAARAYERFLRSRPENAAIWVQLGHMRKESGDYAAAAHAYERASELAPEDAEVHLQIGHLNKLAGNVRLALSAFRRASMLDPTFDAARRELVQLGADMPLSSDAETLASLQQQVRELAGRLAIVEQALAEMAQPVHRR